MLNLFDTGADIVTRTGRALQAAHREFFSPTDYTEIPSHNGSQSGGGRRRKTKTIKKHRRNKNAKKSLRNKSKRGGKRRRNRR